MWQVRVNGSFLRNMSALFVKNINTQSFC